MPPHGNANNDRNERKLVNHGARLDKLERDMKTLADSLDDFRCDVKADYRKLDAVLRGDDGKNGMVSKLNQLVNERAERSMSGFQVKMMLAGAAVAFLLDVALEVVKFFQG